MKVGKGIIKKYSREYNRTLKSGEKKKYITEQIQITVPKNEDIYENKENVLIIPNSEIKEFENRKKENEFLKIANYLHVEDVKELEKQLKEGRDSTNLEYEKEIETLKAKLLKQTNALSEMESKYENLHQDNLKKENETIKDKHSKLIVENENLKNKFVNIKTENENLKAKYTNIKEENKNLKNKCSNLKEERESIHDSYNKVSNKYDILKQENLNTKTSYAEIFEMNENLEKDYDSLLLEYNDLVDKFNDLQEELYNIKSNQTRDDYIASRVKEFILNRS